MEFETYADVIDAYNADDMGYSSLTDYIKDQNIKIKEIDMDPMGDFEKILGKKDGGLMYANGGGVGSMMQPKKKFEMQGGVRNYKPSQMVTAPKTAKSSPDHPTAHLAYITNKEKDLLIKKNLYGSLKGKPNRGPAGIPSLQGDFGGGSYGGHEGADRSGSRDRGTGDYGVSNKAVQDAYNKNRAIREANERAVDKLAGRDTKLSGGINTTSRFGGLGGLLKGALGFFGGLPGKLMSGIMGLKNSKFAEGIEEFGNYPTLDRYFNRNTEKYKDKPYLGQGKTNYSFDGPTLGNELGLQVNRQNETIGPGLRVGQKPTFSDRFAYSMGPQALNADRFANTIGPNGMPPASEYEGMWDGRNNFANPGGFETEAQAYQGVDPSSPEFGGLQQTTARPYNQMNQWNNEIANNPGLKNAINNPQGITSITNSGLQNNATFAGLNKIQKKGLDAKKGHVDSGLFSVDDAWKSIQAWDSDDDPATLEEVKAYYNI